MALTFINPHPIFSTNKVLAIIFKQTQTTNLKTKTIGNFVFILDQDQVIGVNVFNYAKYFRVQKGLHSVTNAIKTYLLKHYNHLVQDRDFQPLLKIGQIITISKHPNNDRLRVLEVKMNDKSRQIVTNLANLQEKQHYLFACDGATLANGLVITTTKVMGVISEGMIVSYESLGIRQSGLVDCTAYQIKDQFKF